MTMMDFWYERAIRDLAGFDDEASELRREAEETLTRPSAEQADEDDE